MKKVRFIMSFILVLMLTFCAAGNVFASSSSQSDSIPDYPTPEKKSNIPITNEYNIETEFEGIYKSSSGVYAMETASENGEEYIPCGKLDINLKTEDDLNTLLNNDDITDEVKEAIKEIYREITEDGRTYESITLFSTEFATDSLPPTASTNTISSYYTYNGAKMRSDRLITRNAGTKTRTIKSGSGTSSVAASIANIAVTVASSANQYISFLASGISLLKDFNNTYGTTWVTMSSEDFLEVALTYDKIDQWTYRQVGNEWHLGLVTQKATVTNIYSRQYYFNLKKREGREKKTDRNVNIVFKSPHFDSPWATAYQWVNSPREEWMTWKCGSVTFKF